ncbi:hypothetical protein [Shewanella frigidimarina]|uniref:hypothetical protein n=1 Tax=Shewanella frigidimarina TaxID=56812 RepID=UPI003D7BC36F
MDVPDYNYLVAYIQKEPDDAIIRAKFNGELRALLYNVNRDTAKDPKGCTAKDYYPWATYETPEEYMSDEQLQAIKDQQNKQAEQDLRNALAMMNN